MLLCSLIKQSLEIQSVIKKKEVIGELYLDAFVVIKTFLLSKYFPFNRE